MRTRRGIKGTNLNNKVFSSAIKMRFLHLSSVFVSLIVRVVSVPANTARGDPGLGPWGPYGEGASIGTCERTHSSSVLVSSDTSSYRSGDFIVQDDCYKMINQPDFEYLAPEKWYIGKGKTVKLAQYRTCELVVGAPTEGFIITPVDMVNLVDAVMKATGVDANSTAGVHGKLGRCHGFFHKTKGWAKQLGAWVDDVDWRIRAEEVFGGGFSDESRAEIASRLRMNRPEYCQGKGGVGRKEICDVQ